MADFSRYIEGEEVKRTRIADDIAAGKFTEDDFSRLLQDSAVKNAYFSHKELERKLESEWTKEYLELLSNAAVAENFNEKYLRHLFGVAQYVQRIEEKKKSKEKSNWFCNRCNCSFCLFDCLCKAMWNRKSWRWNTCPRSPMKMSCLRI